MPALSSSVLIASQVKIFRNMSKIFITTHIFSSGPALSTGDTGASCPCFAGDDDIVMKSQILSMNTSRLKYVSKVYGQTSFMHKPYIYAIYEVSLVLSRENS